MWTYGATSALSTQSYRSMIHVIGHSLVGAGWVDTMAFGSVDTSSVNPPPNTGVRSNGYQVFRMNDALHNAGYPVFIRLDYGNNGYFGEVNPHVAITVGLTHNGSGSVGGSDAGLGFNNTGNTSGLLAFRNPVSGTLYEHRFCIISGGDMGMILANNKSDAAAFAFIERTKDANGNPTTDGVVVGTYGGDAQFRSYRQSYLMFGQINTGQAPQPETFQNYVHSGQAQSVANNDLSVGMFIPMLSYGPGNPLRMMGFTKTSDLAGNTSHTLNVYNTASSYFASSNTAFGAADLSTNSGVTTNTRLIMRSE